MATTASVHARLPVDLIEEMELLAKLTEKTKSSIIYKAVREYVEDMLADHRAAEIALARNANPNRKFYTSIEAEDFLRANCKE